MNLTLNAAVDDNPVVKIAFQSTRGDGVADDLFVMNAGGSNVLRFTTDAGPDQSPRSTE